MTDSRRDLTRITLGVAAIGALTFASFWIVRPFLAPTIWAAMIVIATWPVLIGLEARLGGRRWLAVAAMTTAMLLVFIVPFMLAIGTIVDNADRISGWVTTLMTASAPAAPAWLAKVPLAGDRLTDLWNEIVLAGAGGLMPRLQPYAGGAAQWIIKQAGTLGGALLEFLLTVVITAIMYAHGDTAAVGVRAFGRRLAGARGEEVVNLGGAAIRGVALGVVVTALAQAVLGGIGLAITGVPFAPVLTALMFILCIAQIGPDARHGAGRGVDVLDRRHRMGHRAARLGDRRRHDGQRAAPLPHQEGRRLADIADLRRRDRRAPELRAARRSSSGRSSSRSPTRWSWRG